MIPKSPEEFTTIMNQMMSFKLYVAITIAARKKRLTEHDIALIERSILRDFDIGEKVAEEFKTFEAEPAVKAALGLTKEFVERARAERINQISKSG